MPAKMRWVLAGLLCLTGTTHAQTAPPIRDPYARIIDRADAVALGRVLEAGIREVTVAGGVTPQAFVRIAVERWLVGPDTAQTLEVKLSPYDLFLEDLRKSASQPDRRVILYLARAHETWWLVREVNGALGGPGDGHEVLSTGEALDRITAIRREAEAASPESLAAQADLVVVGSLDFIHDPPRRVICHVERVLAGTPAGSPLTIVTETAGDLHGGKVMLLLMAGANGTWKVLRDGAGCYSLDLDRVGHFAAPPETVFARIAAAFARRARPDGR